MSVACNVTIPASLQEPACPLSSLELPYSIDNIIVILFLKKKSKQVVILQGNFQTSYQTHSIHSEGTKMSHSSANHGAVTPGEALGLA